MTGRGSEEPDAVFGQPELPLEDVDALDSIQRVKQWLSVQPSDASDPDVVAAQLYLADNQSRMQRATRWARVHQIHERSNNEWGVLMHGGTETMWLLDEAAHGLVEGLWLASLLCSHAACERHLAGILAIDEDSLPRSWRNLGLGRLLEEADKRGVVPPDLIERLSTLNETRKVSAHFKPPLHEGSLMRRAWSTEQPDWLRSAEGLAEADAFAAYETGRAVVHRARWP